MPVAVSSVTEVSGGAPSLVERGATPGRTEEQHR